MAPDTVAVFRLMLCPAQTGLLLVGDGVDGAEETVIFTESVLLQPVAVIVSVNL